MEECFVIWLHVACTSQVSYIFVAADRNGSNPCLYRRVRRPGMFTPSPFSRSDVSVGQRTRIGAP